METKTAKFIDAINQALNSIDEGLSPLSHDNSMMRAIRKHMTPRSRRHMKSDDRYRIPDPAKKVKARLKRKSRHQQKPEMNEIADFIISKNGKTLSEQDVASINDKTLMASVVDFLIAMASKGWTKSEGVITNGNYIIDDTDFVSVNDDALSFDGKKFNIDWDWLHTLRAKL